MNASGGADPLIEVRGALLDALEALQEHRSAVVLIGAQAIYLHTGRADTALAEATKDSDLLARGECWPTPTRWPSPASRRPSTALDPRHLAQNPLIEQAMSAAGFCRNLTSPQAGAWLSRFGIPVDLMVPEALASPGGRRGARIPPHDSKATRRAVGLEAAVIDNAPMEIAALAPGDNRRCLVNVAGPAALLIAKLHKLGERQADPRRLEDKDAHDVYRLLVAVPTEALAVTVADLRVDSLAGAVTETAIEYLSTMFAAGPGALGSAMAGRAEEGVGTPETGQRQSPCLQMTC